MFCLDFQRRYDVILFYFLKSETFIIVCRLLRYKRNNSTLRQVVDYFPVPPHPHTPERFIPLLNETTSLSS